MARAGRRLSGAVLSTEQPLLERAPGDETDAVIEAEAKQALGATIEEAIVALQRRQRDAPFRQRRVRAARLLEVVVAHSDGAYQAALDGIGQPIHPGFD